jgi:L-lactate utilization protein LutB
MMNRELIKKNFENKGFKVSFFDTKEAAADYLYESLEGKKLAFGGSSTLKDMGLYEKLSEKNEVIWHWIENT